MSQPASPYVTVIIPNYNHARYLPQRIDSVLNQTFADFELLLLDDCSPDNSRDIIAEYAARDPRIRVVLNEQNSGSTFKQWNKGITLARGSYLWLAESDDVAEPDFLAKLVACLEADKEVVLAYSNSFDIDENDVIKGTWESYLTDLDPQWQADFVREGKGLIQNFMSYRNIIPNASAVVMRLATVRAMGPADESYRVCGDWIFWARLIAQGKVAYVAQPLNYFRSHQNNARSKSFLDGVGLEETSRVLLIMRQYGPPNPVFYRMSIKGLLAYWCDMWVHHGMSWPRHKAVYRNMASVEPLLAFQVLRTMTRLLDKRASGLRILLGDRLLYKLLKK